MKKKVLVGMSGGLDSAFAAKYYIDLGCEVVGAALIFSNHTDIEAAERAANELSIPLLKIDCREDFEKYVVKDFINTYLSGGTPNPCAVCNRFVKMEKLYRASVDLGCDAFATGHYCLPRLLSNGRYAICRAKDGAKDQSYMLWGMTQEQIAHFEAPLGDKIKADIRESAGAAGLSSAQSRESQDICFIPSGDYASFIKERGKNTPPGNFLDSEGRVIGRHKGILNYTVGQRKGLDIALGYRAYVTRIDKEENTVTLAPKEKMYTKNFMVRDICFQATAPFDGQISADVKIRYATKPARAKVEIENGQAYAEFEEAQTLPAPGQSAVFYIDGAVAFGGIIC